ncbi:MAG: type IV pilus assembly protein PilM [Candidatus Poribacteria bacterium]
MFFWNRSILGLDIGSHSIKLVEVKHTKEGPIITCAKAISMEHEVEDSYTEMRKSLRKLLGTLKVRSKRVVTAVSSAEEQVITHSIFMPDITTDISEDAIRASARIEAEEKDYIPYDMDYALINFDIIGEATVDGEQGLEIFFVSAHRDLIRARIELLRDVGLIPMAVEIDILALARLLGFTDSIDDDSDLAIVDIGASKTSLCFYQRGKPYLYPHIPTGGNALTDELSQRLQISWKRAEEYKKLQGNLNSSLGKAVINNCPEESIKFSFAGRLGDSLNAVNTGAKGSIESIEYTADEIFDVLKGGLERSDGLYTLLRSRLEYYEADFERPSKIIAGGGAIQLASLDEFMTSRLSIPLEKISYLEKIPVDDKGDVSDINGNEPLFATAVGLALKRKL